MSHRLKVTLFVLAFNIIGFAEGFLLHELGFQWLAPHYSCHGVGSRTAEWRVAEVGEAVLLLSMRTETFFCASLYTLSELQI